MESARMVDRRLGIDRRIGDGGMMRPIAPIARRTRLLVGIAMIRIAVVPSLDAQSPGRTPDAAPAGRRHADAIFHPLLGEVVLAGGAPARNAADPTALFDDLWAWDGARWRLIANTGTPQMCGRLVFDEGRRRLL